MVDAEKKSTQMLFLVCVFVAMANGQLLVASSDLMIKALSTALTSTAAALALLYMKMSEADEVKSLD